VNVAVANVPIKTPPFRHAAVLARTDLVLATDYDDTSSDLRNEGAVHALEYQ
jgi:hypothetical protein